MMTATTPTAPAITDDAIEHMRGQLRQPWPTQGWNSTAGADAVWHFALGLGDDNPLWWHAEPAKQQVPPMFLYSCENAPVVPGLKQTAERGGVDTWLPGALGLWAGDRWIWHTRVEVGEPIGATTELWDVAERKSSLSERSVAQTTRTVFRGRDDRMLAEVYRSIFRFERSAMTADHYLGLRPAEYTAEDRERMQGQYLAEAGNRRGPEPRYWSDVEIGDPLPTLLKGPLTVTGLVSWVVGWGASMCQSDRVRASLLDRNPGAGIVHPEYGFEDTIEGPHWDDRLAHLGGYPRGYDFGCQRLSWLSQSITDWCGDDGRLAEFDGRLLKPNLIGDTTWVTGRVTGKNADGSTVTCAVEARNQRDDVTASATAVVELPAKA
jgi:hypothetical protein